MITCEEFKDNGHFGDPVINDIIYYKTDIDADLNDKRTRQQAPYPKSGGNAYNINYHSLATNYILTKDELLIFEGDDTPTIIDNIILSIDKTTLNLDLIIYNNSWTNYLPYPLDNPPLIDSETFSQGIVDYWESVNHVQQNCLIGIDPTFSFITNAVTIKANIKTAMDTFTDPETGLVGISSLFHEELCDILKSEMLNFIWTITETSQNDYTNDEGIVINEYGTVTYTVKLIES